MAFLFCVILTFSLPLAISANVRNGQECDNSRDPDPDPNPNADPNTDPDPDPNTDPDPDPEGAHARARMESPRVAIARLV